MIFPKKLTPGDEVRIIAPSRSLAIISEETKRIANLRFQDLNLTLSFGKHITECDDFNSSSISSRLEDLHDAFRDPNIKAIFTVIGGFNVNQLLDGIDYDLIKRNPKILCGYSDITALQNTLYKKTGLVTYSGPHYSTFGMQQGFEWTLEYLKKAIFSSAPYEITTSVKWSNDAWFLDQKNRHYMANEGFWVIQEGETTGTIIGANLCTLNLLKGTPYMPSLENAVLFLEDDAVAGEFSAAEFDRNLQSLIHQPHFDGVRAILIGRFEKNSKMTEKLLRQIISSKKQLATLPVIANVDFGHTDPMITFPIGGQIKIKANFDKVSLKITQH